MRKVTGIEAARGLLERSLAHAPSTTSRINSSLHDIYGEPITPEQAVDRIIKAVQEKGDAALRELTYRIDGVQLASIEVSASLLKEAITRIPKNVLTALKVAADRLREFNESSLPKSWFDSKNGVGQRLRALAKVGIYVPGGTAAYPSTVLHTAITAKVAGVERIVITTPPGKNGTIPDVVLASASIAGVDAVYGVGGAQAIAAMALGTETIPPVDKIVGPGNLFVTIAKRKLFGVVGIEGLHGPTETLIIADETADPEVCAADLLAQAEHDWLSTPVLLTTSKELSLSVPEALKRQLTSLDRANIASSAMENQGVLALVPTIEDAIDLANDFAPEHLCLLVDNPGRYLDQVRNAGGIFIGESSCEVLGDYNAGPSHVMPTGGTARFTSALNVLDFIKVTSIINLSEDQSRELAEPASILAEAEGLTAHAQAAKIRFQKYGPGTRAS